MGVCWRPKLVSLIFGMLSSCSFEANVGGVWLLYWYVRAVGIRQMDAVRRNGFHLEEKRVGIWEVGGYCVRLLLSAT